MDSITQIALGAAVGEATLGRKVGNKAVLWGGFVGLVPDLDILAAPFLDVVERFTYHRSLTHSILFTVVMSPIFGALFARIHRGSGASWRDWSLLVAAALGTHWMLDVLTTYGTQIFWPLSDARVAWDSVFIIDFFYSLPLFATVIAVLFLRRDGRARRVVVTAGLALTTTYLGAGLVSKHVAGEVFERGLARQGIQYEDYITTPTPTNIILWRLTARTPDGYFTGYYSLLDDDDAVDLQYVPANHHLLDGLRDEWHVDRLIWFSRGFYSVERVEGGLAFHNLIFGRLSGPGEPPGDWVFSYRIEQGPGGVAVVEREKSFERSGAFLRAYYERVLGRRSHDISEPQRDRSVQDSHAAGRVDT